MSAVLLKFSASRIVARHRQAAPAPLPALADYSEELELGILAVYFQSIANTFTRLAEARQQ